jgi:hypothetical protein
MELKPRRTFAMRQDYLYVIRCGNLYKIGRSLSPGTRIQQMQLPSKPETVRLYIDMRAAKLERFLHARFADVRERGEWFRLTPEHIEQIDEVCLS